MHGNATFSFLQNCDLMSSYFKVTFQSRASIAEAEVSLVLVSGTGWRISYISLVNRFRFQNTKYNIKRMVVEDDGWFSVLQDTEVSGRVRSLAGREGGYSLGKLRLRDRLDTQRLYKGLHDCSGSHDWRGQTRTS